MSEDPGKGRLGTRLALADPMIFRRAIAPLLLLFLVLGSPQQAKADGFYFEEGFGVTSVGGELGVHYRGGFSIGAGVGVRVGNLMGGAKFEGNFLRLRDPEFNHAAASDAALLRFGPDLRYLFRVRPNVRLYLRGGLNYNVLDGIGQSSYEGNGIEVGSGVIASTKVRAIGFLFWPAFFFGVGPKVSASLWMDMGANYAKLRNDNRASIDVRSSTWKIGFSLGGDF